MSHADAVVEFLESIPAGACCDDCLARKAGVRPAKAVAGICRALVSSGTISRVKGKCPLGDHTRVLNKLVPRSDSAASRGGLSIEEAWRYVDRFCRALWVKHVDGEPPSSLATAITTLRDEGVVPEHEANMMHTIRSLRNLVVHENLPFGDLETTIARSAWEIIRTWGERRQSEAWRLTLKMCA